jgi:ATP-dependent Zn protease
MTEEWITVLVTWMPILLLVGAFVWFGRRQGMGAKGPSGASLIELYEYQVSEIRKMNITLERIAAALEKPTNRAS